MNQESHNPTVTPSKLYGVLAVATVALIVGIIGLTVSLTRDTSTNVTAPPTPPSSNQQTLPQGGTPLQPRGGGISGSSDGPTSGNLPQ